MFDITYGIFQTTHGLSSSLLLPYVFRQPSKMNNLDSV